MRIVEIAIIMFGTLGTADASCPTPTQLDTDLTAAAQADTISLAGTDPTTCPEVSMTQSWAGGKLIFSDSPETPTAKAKLYEDTNLSATSGTDYNRVFLYHVNGKTGTAKMKFTVLIKNTSASSGTLTVQKSGTAGPTTSFLYAGKLAFNRWTTSTAGSGTSVAAGATVRLDSTFDALQASPNNLLTGIWDYSMTQTHQVTICALDQNDNPLTVCPGLSVATRDASHQRGTFPYADKVYDTTSGTQVDTTDDIVQFPIAGDTANDSDAVGTDATDSSSQTLAGNYGVLYRMHLSTKSSDGRNLGLLINPRGGTWGGAIYIVAGLLAGGKFLIPPTTGSNGDNSKASVAGRYAPGSSFTIWDQFMPTGGSALPLRWVLVPH